MIRVSAIVSTYNSAPFFKGCIEDLLQQSLWARGELEIIVVNAGSKQDEGYFIREYFRQGIPLTVMTTQREPLYVSWNRAIRIAKGHYISNANTDDRHCPDAYAIQADALDRQPDIGLVYGDSFITLTSNAVWHSAYEVSVEPPYPTGRFNWPSFDPVVLLQYCYVGPQPMWRRALHDTVGYFDESYLVAGDYEMWLRMVAYGITMQRIDDTLGLFYWHPDQLGRCAQSQSAMESRRAILKHREAVLRQWQP